MWNYQNDDLVVLHVRLCHTFFHKHDDLQHIVAPPMYYNTDGQTIFKITYVLNTDKCATLLQRVCF